MWDTVYCHILILVLIKFSRDRLIVVLWQILTIKTAALDQKVHHTNEYDDTEESSNEERYILTYSVELPDNTPNFLVKSHMFIPFFFYIAKLGKKIEMTKSILLKNIKICIYSKIYSNGETF